MMKNLFIIIVLISLGPACRQKQPANIALPEKQSLPFFIAADFTPQWYDIGKIPDTIHRISNFSFIDQDENNITDKTVDNKIYVADFFFTSCPGICPRLTKNLRVVQDAFKEDPNVIILSHSVTPDKDDVRALKKYAVNYGVIDSKWHLLTGNRDSIYAIARKSYFADEEAGQQGNVNDFLHTENIFLIDTKRRIRGIYKGTAPVEMNNIIADIKLLKEENK